MTRPSNVLILAATGKEIEPLVRLVEGWRALEDAFNASEGSLSGRRVILAETGPGKSNAALAAYDLIGRYEPEWVIGTGCAGAFRPSGLKIGDVALADLEVFADEGSSSPEGFLDLQEIDLPLWRDRFGRPLYNAIPVAPPPEGFGGEDAGRGFEVRAGCLVTVSSASGTDERAGEIHERWQALAESLEGAAVALAALRRGRPFLEVRGISNLAGNRDRGEWDIPRACANAASVVAALLASPLPPPE
jgi:futalosine hydrolase